MRFSTTLPGLHIAKRKICFPESSAIRLPPIFYQNRAIQPTDTTLFLRYDRQGIVRIHVTVYSQLGSNARETGGSISLPGCHADGSNTHLIKVSRGTTTFRCMQSEQRWRILGRRLSRRRSETRRPVVAPVANFAWRSGIWSSYDLVHHTNASSHRPVDQCCPVDPSLSLRGCALEFR